jgi:hypothetical protein
MKRSLSKPFSLKESVSVMVGVIGIVASYFAIPPFLDQFARAGDLHVAMTKADIALSEHIRYLSIEIGRLENKIKAGQGTRYDHDQLKYLREKLDQLQKVQRGGE